MKLLEKIKNLFRTPQPEESKILKADYQLYAIDSEKAKKVQAYQAIVTENTPGYLLLDTLSHLLWSQDDFIDLYWYHIGRAKILQCQPKNGKDNFYIFAVPYIKESNTQGWIGFIIGSRKEVFVSEVNHSVSEAPHTFEVPMEQTDSYLCCENTSSADLLRRVNGIFPAIRVLGILKRKDNGWQYCSANSRTFL